MNKFFLIFIPLRQHFTGPSKDRGAALVVTLAVVSLLVATGLGVSRFVAGKVMETQYQRDVFQAEQWALSGVHLAMMTLEQDAAKTSTDSVQEIWADSRKMSAAANALLGIHDRITLCVTDELSRVQINALIREFPGHDVNPDQVGILEGLFSHILAKAEEPDAREEMPGPMAMVNALTDWLDSGDDDRITGLSGAESDYYQRLVPPYLPANGPFERIDEICNVKGINCVLFSRILNPEKDKFGKHPLEDLITVHGLSLHRSSYPRFSYPGKININTAPLPVLQALLPRGMGKLAQELVAFREETSENGYVFVNTLDKGWYKKVIALSEKEQKRFDRIITYESHIFRVESSARKNDARASFVAFVTRNGRPEKKKGFLEQPNTANTGICRIMQIQRK